MRSLTPTRALLLGALLLTVPTAQTLAQGDLTRTNASDRIARLLFAPELVMRHQGELGLTRQQKDTLVAEMQAAQSDLVPLQLEMAEVAGNLGRLLGRPTVDEESVLAAANRVMDLERQIKTRHLRLVIRIKNMLSPEQQATLRRIRANQWEQRRQGGGR